jgi:pimeloyl-ACP methyl ester carboxylesterase
MGIEFIRFKATDAVELQGWLSVSSGDVAVIHIHGMSGNGYENYFLDVLRSLYSKMGISFFTIDTRGRGIISDFRQKDSIKSGGSCFEIFDESEFDISGALQYLQSLGKKKIILQGHSLGCSKIVNCWIKKTAGGVIGAILLAPTDMPGWANTDPNNAKYLKRAEQLLVAGKGRELVGQQCWSDKTPISAQTYPSICAPGASSDIYGDRDGGALLGRLDIPTLIVYGTKDIGIIDIDGSIDKWRKRADGIINKNTSIGIVEGATHSFKGYEQVLAGLVETFTSRLVKVA